MGFLRSSTGELVYRLSPEEELDVESYAMLRNNTMEHMLSVTLAQEDGERELRYDTESMQVAQSYFATHVFSRRAYVDVLENVMGAFTEAHEYMMPASGLVASIDLMYVGPDLDVKMAYLPVVDIEVGFGVQQCLQMVTQSLEADRAELDLSYLTTIRAEINDPAFSVKQFKRTLSSLTTKEHKAAVQQSRHASDGNVSAVTPPTEDDVVDMDEGKGLFGGIFGGKKKASPKEEEKQGKKGLGFFSRKESRQAPLDVPFQIPGQDPIAIPQNADSGRAPNQQDATPFSSARETPSAGITTPDNVGQMSRQPAQARQLQSENPFDLYVVENFGATEVAGVGLVKMKPDGPQSTSKTQVTVPAYITRVSTGETKLIDSVPYRIGRREKMVDFYVPDDAGVSRVHALVDFDGRRFTIQDCNSGNHTFLNGAQIATNKPVYLEDGDVIHLGNVKFRFTLG